MGAVTFSLDKKLIQTLSKHLPLSVFIETGTFKGDTVEIVRSFFKKIYTIELSHEYYQIAAERYKNDSAVIVMQGDSATLLTNIITQENNQPIIYWLDAHWCVAANTAGQESQCPLLAEIAAIQSLNEDSIVIIDDARLFLATPPEPHETTHWPIFQDILVALQKLNAHHEIMVLNDNIIFYPKKLSQPLSVYARRYGIDWLHALNLSREHATLYKHLVEKEAMIESLRKICDERVHVINEQVKKINSLAEKHANLVVINNENQHDITYTLEQKIKLLEELLAMQQGATHAKENQIGLLKELLTEKELRLLALQKKPHMSAEEKNILLATDSTTPSSENLENHTHDYAAIAKTRLDIIIQLKEKLNHFYYERFLNSLKRYLAPQLGQLHQHEPITLKIPQHYYSEKKLSAPPKISIVTPSYNQAAFLERTLLSVIQQGYSNLELIVQDGGSTDDSATLLKQYEKYLAHWESKKDNGQSHAINLGFEHATGEIMAYLNSDDLLMPGALNYIAHYFDTHPEVDVVYGNRIIIDENDNEVGRWILPPHSNKILDWVDFIPQETLFWRRRIWDQAGGKIDEHFQFAMDWDLLLRFKAARARFVRIPRFLGAFRVHSQQKTSAQIGQSGIREMAELRLRTHKRAVNHLEIKKKMVFYLAKHIIHYKINHLLHRFHRLKTLITN